MESFKTLSEAAKYYLGNNLSAIPTRADKLPALSSWKPYQKTRMKDEAVESLFNRQNVKGLAIICGEISGNLEVLDIDCKNDGTGKMWPEFYNLVKDLLPELLARLVIATTINKGYHFFYKCNKIEGNKHLSKNAQQEVLMETRGEGGYVMVAPTPGYQFVQGSLDNIPLITPEERSAMFGIAKSFDELLPAPVKPSLPIFSGGGLSPFDDYNGRADIPALLVKHHWSNVKTQGERIYLVRPGNTKNKYSANYHTRMRLFYPFTTSSLFEANKAYNPVQVYTLLEAHGDLSRASKQLYEQGYGDRRTSKPESELVKEAVIEPATIDLPIDGFPHQLQDMINTCAETYRTPRDYWAGAVLIASALAIGDKLELIDKYKNAPVLWLVLVGDVSSGKSNPIDFCLSYFKKLDALSIRKYETDFQEYERVLKMNKEERLEEGIYNKITKPECFQYILNDFTPEAMVAVHKVNNRGLLIERDELKGWIDDFNRYSKSGEQSNMLSSWTGLSITYNRKTSGTMIIPKPWISVCGGMQPELLPTLAADSRAENGFLSRFCAVYPDHTEKSDYNKAVVAHEVVDQWEEYLSKLINIEIQQKIGLSKEAEQKYAEWYNMNAKMTNNEPLGYLKGVYGKLDIISLRLAIVMRGMNMACDGVFSDVITVEEMEAAIALTEYFRATAMKVYNRIFENPTKYQADKKSVIKYLNSLGVLNKSQIAVAVKTCRAQVNKVLAE